MISVCYSTLLNYRTLTSIEQVVNKFLSSLGGIIHYISYCFSFFIFAGISKAFRLELKRLAWKFYRKDLTAARQNGSNQQEPARDNIELNNVVSTIVIYAQ